MPKLKDSFIITKVLLNEVFNNILSNNIFNKKRNRYILFGCILFAYIMYFILNMSELNKIYVSQNETSTELYNILFSSLTNVILIISGFIYLIVTISFSVTERMQYQLKILPFEKGSIWLGSMIFKLLLGYCSFLIIFAIIIPLLKLFHNSLMLNILILLYCQLLFFTSVSFYYFLFHSISKILKLTYYNINNILLVIFLFFYFFIFRFKIDLKIQSLNIEINNSFILMLMFLLSILLSFLILGIYYFQIKNNEEIYSSSDFYSFKITTKMNHITLILLGTFRNKLTLKLFGIVFIFFSLSFIDTKDVFISLSTLAYIYPIISFSGIRYFSTTVSYRKMNSFFGLTPLKETLITSLVNLIVNLPLLITSIILSGDYVRTAYYGLIIFEAATIMGIVFPKNKSSVNEFSASIMCVVLAVSLYMVSNNFLTFIIIFILLNLVKYLLVKRSLLDEAI